MKKTAIAALLLVSSVTPGIGASYDELNAAISYFNQDQHENAITWFNKAIGAGDLTPDLTRIAYLNRGSIYARTGRIPQALSDYAAAIAAKPDDPQAYRQRALIYWALGDHEKALADYIALRNLRPNNHENQMNVGYLSWILGQFETSASAFTYFSARSATSWIWLQLANTRLKNPMTDFTEDTSAQRWPGPVARFYKGSISEGSALSAAGSDTGEQCDANLYVGLWRLVRDDKAGAEPFLKAASEKCPKGSPYWRIVRIQLGLPVVEKAR